MHWYLPCQLWISKEYTIRQKITKTGIAATKPESLNLTQRSGEMKLPEQSGIESRLTNDGGYRTNWDFLSVCWNNYNTSIGVPVLLMTSFLRNNRKAIPG
jgi:hypothetical protein